MGGGCVSTDNLHYGPDSCMCFIDLAYLGDVFPLITSIMAQVHVHVSLI